MSGNASRRIMKERQRGAVSLVNWRTCYEAMRLINKDGGGRSVVPAVIIPAIPLHRGEVATARVFGPLDSRGCGSSNCRPRGPLVARAARVVILEATMTRCRCYRSMSDLCSYLSSSITDHSNAECR